MLVVTPIRAFSDNYIWSFRASDSNTCYVVDPGDSTPVLDYLKKEKLELEAILVTHHHFDHVGGIAKLLEYKQVPVFGPSSTKITDITHPLTEGQHFKLSEYTLNVLATPGHTLDHLVYYIEPGEEAPILFCGDTLFSGGCGRLFEGTPEQMLQSLEKLSALPDETRVFCAHEYTQSNLAFAQFLEPDNKVLQQHMSKVMTLRQNNQPTLPSSIQLERSINPFLRTRIPSIIDKANALGSPANQDSSEIFHIIRQLKDNF